jgi:hypothetical protein
VEIIAAVISVIGAIVSAFIPIFTFARQAKVQRDIQLAAGKFAVYTEFIGTAVRYQMNSLDENNRDYGPFKEAADKVKLVTTPKTAALIDDLCQHANPLLYPGQTPTDWENAVLTQWNPRFEKIRKALSDELMVNT